MYAIHVDDEHKLSWAPTELDAPAPSEVQIQVHAAGVNRADLAQRAGRYPPPPGASPILGLEVSGVIVACGDQVRSHTVGDRVSALLAGGGYAERVNVDARHVITIPDSVSFATAAGWMETFATAWLNLGDLAGLASRTPRARVVLHAAGSGVGTAGLQLCRAWGHHTLAIAGSDAKLSRCATLGATHLCNRHTQRWTDVLRDTLGEADVILDPVGASTVPDGLRALATDGTLVLIGLLGGRRAEVDLGRLLIKRARIQGSTLRARSADFKARLVATLASQVLPRIVDQSLTVPIDATFPIKDADAAHRLLASNETFGKLVLKVTDA